jgi:hypothetical protein
MGKNDDQRMEVDGMALISTKTLPREDQNH